MKYATPEDAELARKNQQRAYRLRRRERTHMPSIISSPPHDEPACFAELDDEAGSRIGTHFKIVAVRGAIGDWAAYFGPDDWNFSTVAEQGTKLPYEAAKALFPNITGEYRQ